MAGIRINTFAGVAPRLEPRLLPADVAQEALDVLLDSGVLEALPLDDSQANPTGVDSMTKTIFRVSGSDWFEFDEDVDVIRGPIAEDPWGRLYWTDSSYPKMADEATALGGGGRLPGGSFRLGIPAPELNVTTAVSGMGVEGGEAVERAYVFTYVSQYGEEGPPSQVTTGEIITVTEGQTVTLTFPTNPSGAYNLVGKRVYRTDPNGLFRFVGEVGIASATLEDTVLDSNLGEQIPSTDWDPPPDDVIAEHPDGPLRGLTALADGSVAGFVGRTLCFSESELPHAFPRQYQLATDWDIVGIAEIDGGVVIGTKGKPYIALGSSPSSRELRRIDENAACLSKRGMVDMGGYVLYPSPEGLIQASLEGAVNVTEGLIAPEDWRATYAPSTIHAYRWEGKYVAFHSGGGFIFDPRGGKNAMIPLSFTAQCGFVDEEEGELYLVVSGQMVRFARGSGVRPGRWKSKVFSLQQPIAPACARVRADTYPVRVKGWADGVERINVLVQDDGVFWLPSGYFAHEFEFEVSELDGRVYEIWVAEDPEEQF